MQMYVLINRVTGLFAARECTGQHDGRFSDDIADAKEFYSYGAAADFGQNFDDTWQPEAVFDNHVASASFAPGARCSDLDAHPFSGVTSAGEY